MCEYKNDKDAKGNIIEAIKNKLEENIADQFVSNVISDGLSQLFYSIYYIDYDNNKYICFKEINSLSGLVGTQGNYKEGIIDYIDRMVVEEDRHNLLHFLNSIDLPTNLAKTKTLSYVFRRNDVGWTRCKMVAIDKDDKRISKFLLITIDINEEVKLKREFTKAEYEAHHDKLTGLLNRAGFEKLINDGRLDHKFLSIMMVDIDNFKIVNDTYGHSVGDEILARVASLLQSVFVKTKHVIRYGGDEFVVLLEDGRDGDWKNICHRLSSIHEELNDVLSYGIKVTCSVGVYFSKDGYKEEYLKYADEALYYSKNNGRCGCSLYANGKITKYWHDGNTLINSTAILKHFNFGTLWIDDDNKLCCDEPMKCMLGFNYKDSKDAYQKFMNLFDKHEQDKLKALFKEAHSKSMVETIVESKEHERYRIGLYVDKNGEDSVYGFIHNLKETKILTD